MRFQTWSLLGLILFFGFVASADELEAPFGSHPGYLSDVKEERTKRDIEMVLLDPPQDERKPIKEVIFDPRLTREFQQQYQFRFGQTQAEQVRNSPGRFDNYSYFSDRSITVAEYRRLQQTFGEYMARRLVEHHVDAWVKKEPTLRPVYTLKDRVTNLNVQVKKGYKFKWRYSFSGPSMEFDLENPYDIETRVVLQMAGIISEPVESTLSLGYNLNPRWRLSGVTRQVDGLYQMIVSRRLNRSMSTSLTASTDQKPFGPVVQQDLVLLGLSWSD